MKKIYPFLFLLLLNHVLFAQGQANTWYFGANAGLDFNSGSPVALTNGVLTTNEGCASISDKNGNLLFYSDGIRVWNRNHVQMSNGFGLTGDPSSAQSALIVPKPGNQNRYYVFTVAASGNTGGFCYSEVDMTLNAGLGDVISATKNTLLFTPSAEKCTAVKHANGLYVWVLAHGYTGSNRYYAYLVDCSGVNSPVTTDVGQNDGFPGWGYLIASPNGQKLASAVRNSGFELLDFDNATGVVSNPINLGLGGDDYGVSFSPDNNLLYGSRITPGTMYQWNLQAGSPAAIIASVVTLGTAGGTGSPYRGGAMQLGPDGKLYVCQYQQPFLSVINSPNTLGVGCNLQFNAVDLLSRNSILGLPPFIQSYFDTTPIIQHPTATCLGQPTAFTISGNTSYLDSVKWNFDDAGSGVQNLSKQFSPTHIFSTSGNFNVSLIRFVGCISDTAYSIVDVIGPILSSQSVTICPNGAYTLPAGSVVTSAGVYVDTISASNTCDSIITTNLSVAAVSVDAGNNTAICNRSSAQLNATGNGLIYSWTPIAGLDNANISNPIASPITTTTYTVSSQAPIGNAIVNGDFSSGNTGFSSSYNYTTNNTTEGQYNVGPNAAAWNGGMAACGDHTTGSGNMLYVNGATSANVSIYCETVSVLPNTTYAFSTWLTTLSLGNLAQLQFSINGSLLGSVFTAPAALCVWQQFYNTWNSGANTTATICIVNQNTNAGANDFALDDIAFSQLCTLTDSVVVTVYPTYSNTVNATICQNQNYTLPDGTVTNLAGTYIDTLATIHNCDSIITTNLTVNPTYAYSVSQTICPSDLYILPSGTPVNATGVYVDTLSTVIGCDSIITTNLTVVPPAITVSNDTQVCLGSSVQLNSNGGLYTYTWTPTATLDNPNIANPVATPTQTTSYIVTTQVASGDLIGNGNFESGNAVFNSSYTYQSDVTPAGTYYVGANPITYHSGFSPCTDHTSGNGNTMIVNGAGTAGTSVWCETINVVPNTNYAFGCWAESVANGSPAILQFSINGNLLGTPFNVSAPVCQWQQFYSVWNSGANTTASICIVNQNTTGGGNDFALDDISFIGLCNVSDTVTITVHNPTTTNLSPAVCQGTTYTFPSGATSTASVIDTSLLLDRFGCDSTIITNLTVNPTYLVNVIDTVCSNQNYVLPSGNSANATGIYTDTLSTIAGCDSIIVTNLTVHPTSATTVYDTICNGSIFILPDGNSVSSTGTYPVTLANQYGCDSLVTTNLTVITIVLPATQADVLCNGGSTGSISTSATGGVSPYNYDLLTGGSIVSNNANGNFTSLVAGNYSVVATDDLGCSATTSVTINEPQPLVIADSVKNVRCFGDDNGEVFVSATGGTPTYSFNLNNQSFNSSGLFTSLAAGNYSYTVTDAHGCADSSNTSVTEPQAITVSLNPASATINLGEAIQLNASSNYDPTATYLWSPNIGLSCYTCPNPVFDAYNSIEYTLAVTAAIDGNDCSAETKVPVTVIPKYHIFIPNVFTPNNDGNNDLFQIFGNLPALKFVDIEIFNRIGEKVFESNDLQFAWDGTYKGKTLQPGVFVYTLRAVFVDNHTEKIYKGSLTLLR